MNLEGLATDTLNLPGVKTLRHVVSVGQHTYESVSTAPIGQCCMFARPNGTKRQVLVDTPHRGLPAARKSVLVTPLLLGNSAPPD